MGIRAAGALIIFYTLLGCPATVAGQPQVPQTAPHPAKIAKEVNYERKDTRSPDGLPWSVHVLRVDRKTKSIMIRAASAPGEMRRELPTEIARQAVRAGEELLAVVNGDYDIAAPYLGISDGVSITSITSGTSGASGHFWTSGKAAWPALALRKNGQPLLGVPQVHMELRVGGRTFTMAALNKPLASVHGAGPRIYTRDFRESVKSDQPFRAILVGKLSSALPLRANQRIRGEVLRVLESANEMAIPPDAIVIAERIPVGATANLAVASTLLPFHSSTFSMGTRVELRFDVRMAGHRDLRDAIGGFPIVVQNGKRAIVGEPGANLKLRHPRTAVCYNAREIIFVVVDGRQPQLSVGMTLEELGDLMVSLGCTEALNTDGGGSSVMAITMPPLPGATPFPAIATPQPGGHTGPPLQIVNSPSDGKERGRGNAWVILKKP